jgi:hypothetical protein
VVAHDGEADRQSQADPLPHALGREEGIEDPSQVLLRDAGAVVREGQDDAAVPVLAADAQGPRAAMVEHRLLGVRDQVVEDQLQLVEVPEDQRQLGIEAGHDLDARRPQVVRLALERLQQHAAQAQRALLRLLAPRDAQQVADDLRRPVRLAQDDVDPLAQLPVERLQLHELRVSQDGAQGIVQLVRDAGQQAPERHHLLVLDDLFLGVLHLLQPRLQLLVQPRVPQRQRHERRQDHGALAVALAVARLELHPADIQDSEELAAHGEGTDDGRLHGAKRLDPGEPRVRSDVVVDDHRLRLERHAPGHALADRHVETGQVPSPFPRRMREVQLAILVQQHQRGVVGPQDVHGGAHDPGVQVPRVQGREDRPAQLVQRQALEELASLQRPSHGEQKVLQEQRLRQEVEDPGTQAFDRFLVRPVGGHHDKLNVGADLADAGDRLDAVDSRHHEVAEREVEARRLDLLDGLRTVLGRLDAIAVLAQDRLQEVPQLHFVVDDQDVRRDRARQQSGLR